jgi:hypothetical protein
MHYQRSGLLRAVFVAMVPPIVIGVLLLLIEYNVFQRGNGNDDDPTATSGSTDPATNTPAGPGGATATFTVFVPGGEASITLSVDSGPPGTELTVSGSGFAPGETVVLYFHTRGVGRVNADGDGAFTDVDVQVPSDWQFTGQFDFIATGQTSIRTASMPFEVT